MQLETAKWIKLTTHKLQLIGLLLKQIKKTLEKP